MIHKGKEKQTELEILNVDDKLHSAIVKQFVRLITLDLVSFLVVAVVMGYFTFRSGISIVPGVVCAISVFVLLWNLVSLLKVVGKKYICCLVKVDKLWEEKGVVLCRVAPDTYNNHDFTGAITVKNFTKTPEEYNEKYPDAIRYWSACMI